MLYKRILLKISGEMLASKDGEVFDYEFIGRFIEKLATVQKKGIQIVLVVGAGNIFRARKGLKYNIPQVAGDTIGMVSILVNALCVAEIARSVGIQCSVYSSFFIPQVAPLFTKKDAINSLERNEIVILAGGTSQPFFTTDSTAALRALELDCEVVLKATKVEGVYDKDPAVYQDAQKFDDLTYDEVLEKRLNVMDMSAFALCRDYKLPIRVFSLENLDNIENVLTDPTIGTLIHN